MNDCNLLVPCFSFFPVLKAIISKQNYLAVKKLIYFGPAFQPLFCLWNYNNHALPSSASYVMFYPIIFFPLVFK